MASEREQRFLEMTREFPDSPMGFFSLGRLYLDEQRWAESVTALATAVKLDPNYSAAWVALGDAQVGNGARDDAKTTWQRALETPHARKDLSLQSDLEQRLRDLEDF
jgi:cytochrome c-type biogenesis protein CcmH/NrfG